MQVLERTGSMGRATSATHYADSRAACSQAPRPARGMRIRRSSWSVVTRVRARSGPPSPCSVSKQALRVSNSSCGYDCPSSAPRPITRIESMSERTSEFRSTRRRRSSPRAFRSVNNQADAPSLRLAGTEGGTDGHSRLEARPRRHRHRDLDPPTRRTVRGRLRHGRSRPSTR